MSRGIASYIAGRFLQSVMVLWVIVTLLFLLFRLAPSNPMASYIDTEFTKEQEQALLARFGLDRPLHEQYVIYLINLLKLDLGDTFHYAGTTVIDVLRADLPNTLYLTLTSLLLAYSVGVLGGIAYAALRGSRIERVGTTFTLMTRAAPQFWVGMLLLTLFAFHWKLLPSSGIGPAVVRYRWDTEWDKLLSPVFWRHMILPTFTLAIYLHGLPLLLMRSNMLEVLDQDFIVMGRLAGYSERRLMIQYAARNAVLPVLTALTLGIGYSIGGNVVIETVFAWPGLGRTLVRAVQSADYPLAQGAFFLIALIIVVMNFIADILYSLLDPRVGASAQAQVS
ncbi:MAG: ABC transporter permease [Chloroflexi bacterium]|nr:ABC transporter permease [Chloroflexota bacterium]MCY3582520.1 ABC transporter permease [Chloroflexota bacterium]MCY3717422.1 ABC transporter permease [Chloroflexota bacterium]MDE2650353.1 ABC transporter permease [Chloroflexota bacterium]MXV93219.1 ABC transporter permease [Chloroflexota bacterium]